MNNWKLKLDKLRTKIRCMFWIIKIKTTHKCFGEVIHHFKALNEKQMS